MKVEMKPDLCAEPRAEPRAEQLAEQCRAWNAQHAHQVRAGRARAARMTREERSAYGSASFAKQSALWRATQGLPPLSAADAARIAPDAIRQMTGAPLPAELRALIHRGWCAGVLLGVGYWVRFPAWAESIRQRLDAEAQGIAQPALLSFPAFADDLSDEVSDEVADDLPLRDVAG